MMDDMSSAEKVIVTLVVCAVVILIGLALTKNSGKKHTEKAAEKESNLYGLEAKFRCDYINQKLSEYADLNGIADETVKKVYPGYKKDLNNAAIKWTEFNGAISELEERLIKFDGGGSTPQRRFTNMLASECKPEIDALIAKIKELQ